MDNTRGMEGYGVIENRNMEEELDNKTEIRGTFMTQMLQEIRASNDPI